MSSRSVARWSSLTLPLLLGWVCTACGGDDGGAGDSDGSTSADDSTSTSPGGVDTTTAEPPVDTSSDSGDSTTTGSGLCFDEFPAIVTDIDETLTTADAEFLMQLGDASYDPAERDGGAALISAYADLGYRILYLTARAENLSAPTGESARELTQAWLVDHGYPVDPETTELVLAPNLVTGDATRTYKAGALMERQELGLRFDYAYGNATTDIDAYADAGIDLANTFIIGPEAGVGGTVAIEGEGWIDHTAAHLPTVPAVCQ